MFYILIITFLLSYACGLHDGYKWGKSAMKKEIDDSTKCAFYLADYKPPCKDYTLDFFGIQKQTAKYKAQAKHIDKNIVELRMMKLTAVVRQATFKMEHRAMNLNYSFMSGCESARNLLEDFHKQAYSGTECKKIYYPHREEYVYNFNSDGQVKSRRVVRIEK